MINVAILDDEAVYLDKEKEITEAYFREKQEDCRVDTFQSIEWFVSGLKETCYDLYILDVEMPGKNGLEVSREIRKLYPEPVIIFITNYVDYAIEAYEVNTFRYIPKSRLETKLTEAYDALFLILMEKNEKYYVIEKKGTLEKLAYSEIFYLRKEGKNVVFVHRSGETGIRASLSSLEEQLASDGFIMADRGYLVNIRHVMSMKNHDLYMRNGNIVTVGRERFKSVKQAIVDFWER